MSNSVPAYDYMTSVAYDAWEQGLDWLAVVRQEATTALDQGASRLTIEEALGGAILNMEAKLLLAE